MSLAKRSTRVRLCLPVLVVAALLAASAAPAHFAGTGHTDENFIGTDETGNLAVLAQDGRDVSIGGAFLIPTRLLPAHPADLSPLPPSERCIFGRGDCL